RHGARSPRLDLRGLRRRDRRARQRLQGVLGDVRAEGLMRARDAAPPSRSRRSPACDELASPSSAAAPPPSSTRPRPHEPAEEEPEAAPVKAPVLLGIGLLAVLSTGCVTKREYERVKNDRDALEASLNELKRYQPDLEAENRRLKNEVERLELLAGDKGRT